MRPALRALELSHGTHDRRRKIAAGDENLKGLNFSWPFGKVGLKMLAQRAKPSFVELFTPKLVTVWREGYHLADLRADVIAGLTVAVVAIPLSMAIAIASGVTRSIQATLRPKAFAPQASHGFDDMNRTSAGGTPRTVSIRA